MRQPIPRVALAAVIAMVAALAVATSQAAASWTFRFENHTSATFTANDESSPEGACWYEEIGAFKPESTKGAVSASVSSQSSPFECHDTWEAKLAYDQQYIGSYENEGAVNLFFGGVGAFVFHAYDPWFARATLDCEAAGPEWEEANGETPIEPYMTAEVEGQTCNVAWVPGYTPTQSALEATAPRAYAGHVRFVDGLAQVFRRRAGVRVDIFGLGHARRRVTITLRTAGGDPIGEASRVLPVGGRARTIPVPLSAAALRELHARREFLIHAAVRIDSKGGTGDTTPQLLLRPYR